MPVRHTIFPSHDAMAAAVAELIERELRTAVRKKRTAVLALCGGSTPASAYRLIAGADVDWSRIEVVQTDERITDDYSSTSASVIEENLIHLADIPRSRWHPMPTHVGDLDEKARSYAALLADLTKGGTPDIAVLGLGEDGHTASLFADDPAAHVDAEVVATGPYQGTMRLSLSLPVLTATPVRVVLAAGRSKTSAVSRLLKGATPELDPTSRVLGIDGQLFVEKSADPGVEVRSEGGR